MPRKTKALAEELGVTPAYVGGNLWAYVVNYKPSVSALVLQHRNPDNREVSQTHIDGMALSMPDHFPLTGETVAFDENANLINGQQRLLANVKSGAAVPMLTVFNVNREKAFPVIDHGRNRSLKDALFLEDRSRKNTQVIAGALRACWGMVNGWIHLGHIPKKYTPTDDVFLKFLAQHPDINTAVHKILTTCRCPTFKANQSFSVALMWATGRIDRKLSEEMFTNMADNSMPKEPRWDAPRRFTKRVTHIDEADKGLDRVMYRALLIKAWNFFYAEEGTGNLAWNSKSERFPKIEGLEYSLDNLTIIDKKLWPIKQV
jgi:hypothetical protein